MRKLFFSGVIIATTLGFASSSWAFSCPNNFKAAQAAIDDAMTAMKAMSDKGKMGYVHTLIDDAKMLLSSGMHNHAKPAAGAYDHARAVAKADAAKGYAQAAETLSKK